MSNREALNELLGSGTFRQVRAMLNTISPADIAHLIESSPPQTRKIFWALIEPEMMGEVLLHLSEDVRLTFVEKMDAAELAALTEDLDTDDLADILQSLPETVIKEVLQSMDTQDRQRVEAVLSYPEDTAGELMNTDTVAVRPDVTLGVVLRYLQFRGELPESTDKLFVVTRHDDYLGTINLTKLLTCPGDDTIAQHMKNIDPILAETPAHEVAHLFERHDLISTAVVNSQGKLLGRITIDDVVDVIRHEAEQPMMSMAGLDEDEDTFAPILNSTKRRAIWLGINLATCILASSVINLFKDTIDQVVALAVLMPIVASMGGVAGTQTLTLVIRGMALGQVGGSNTGWLVAKELAVGSLNGMLWAGVIATIAGFWFHNWKLSSIIASAMVINLIVAALAGAALPLLLRKFKIDPAVSASVILTTFTDVVGFFVFLGLATYFLI